MEKDYHCTGFCDNNLNFYQFSNIWEGPILYKGGCFRQIKEDLSYFSGKFMSLCIMLFIISFLNMLMVAIFFCVSKKKIKSSGKTTMMRSLSLFGKNNDKLIERLM